MAKSIIKKKTKDNGYNFLISANLDKKKLFKNFEKSILSALKTKGSNLQFDNLVISIDGVKKTIPNYWKRIAILLSLIIIGLLIFLFKFFNFQNLSPVAQKSFTEIITISPTSTPSPKVINHNLNILILNASRHQGIALNLKKTLNQNKFENLIIGNNKQIIDSVSIEYKLGCEYEAKYLKENYLGLAGSVLSELKNTTISNDIIITLGNSYIYK